MSLGLAASGRAAEVCFTCHPAPGLAKRIAGDQRTSPEVEALLFKGDAHVSVNCVECHREAGTIPHPDQMEPAACQSCHEAVRAHVLGHERTETNGHLPGCLTCHGHHGILRPDNPDSPVSHLNVPDLCTKCHGGTVDSPFAYGTSVHGKAHMRDPKSPAAVCTDCHGAHPEEKEGNLLTTVTRAHLPETCGRCHTEVHDVYRASVHGRAATAGEREAAVCTDCHGEHKILAPGDPGSSVYATQVPETCGQCHGAEALAETTGLIPVAYDTYRESYHGVASTYGSTTVAHCASCHGAHNVRPSSDPESGIHPANLATTCGECHPGITDKVARGRIHLEVTREGSPIVYWVAFGFRWLTIGTMMALIGHIILDFAKKVKLRRDAARSGGEAT